MKIIRFSEAKINLVSDGRIKAILRLRKSGKSLGKIGKRFCISESRVTILIGEGELIIERMSRLQRAIKNGKVGDLSIDDLPVSTRIRNALHRIACWTVKDVAETTEMELIKARNMGKKSIRELREILILMGMPSVTK